VPVLFQKVIKRSDLMRNPAVLYVFGDNATRRGRKGQALEMRYEGNGVGVRTKYSPYSHFIEQAGSTIAQKRMIDEDMKPLFDLVKRGGIVVWPTDGVGTGEADLPRCAPTTFEYLEAKLAALISAAELFQPGDLS
jgi:hypothetical protein